MKKSLYIILAVIWVCVLACRKQQPDKNQTSFTKVDSLTETYLVLQDSLLHAWNVMAWDEKEKIKAMHNLLHLMQKRDGFDDEQLITLEQRLEQLDRIRFTQKSLANSYVIEEYDFASNSIVSEILSLVESDTDFIKSDDVQKYIDKVKMADQRVIDYRSQYDQIAARYNRFIERNRDYLKEIDRNHSGEKRALFQMAAE